MVTPGTHRVLRAAGRHVLVYQVHYDEASRRSLDERFTPVANTVPGRSLEAALLGKLLDSGEPPPGIDYAGVFSWKFSRKIPLSVDAMLERMAADGFAADVYSFFGASKARSVWQTAEGKHPGIVAAAETLLERAASIHEDLTGLATPIIYQHHFLARPAVLRRYHAEVLRPSLALLEGGAGEDLARLLERDSTYRDPRWTPERLADVYGLPYLPLHPFIAERLFPTWLACRPEIRTRQIWRGRFVERERLGSEPELDEAGAEEG